MYKQSYKADFGKSLECPECKQKRFTYKYNSVECTNCGWQHKVTQNKYGAVRTVYNDRKYDSKFEASVAQTLDLRMKGKDIKDFDKQYRVEMWIYRSDGTKAFRVNHKVDFRIHHNDGSYELLEAKGVETPDYKWRRRLLEKLWLPEHLDHTYTVVKQ